MTHDVPVLSTPSQFIIHRFDRLNSTNQTLWEFVEAGTIPGTVVIATEQSAGQGQWGRQWNSAAGGLYLSAYWQPQITASRVLQLTLCSAWGIAVALRDRGVPVALKWPNDLVLKGRKLGGILTQTRIHQGKIDRAVVGVGINWDNPVPETGITLQSFWQDGDPQGAIATLDELADVILQGLARGWQFWERQGTNALVAAYNALLVNISQVVELDSQTVVVVGIAPDGRLRVRLNSQVGDDFPEISVEPGKISLGYDLHQG